MLKLGIDPIILTRCFNQSSATNSIKSNKALTCWVHDVLMQRSGKRYKGQARGIRGGTISIIDCRHQPWKEAQSRSFEDIYEDDGCDILPIAFRNGFAISKGSNQDRFAIRRKNVDDNPAISDGDKFSERITLEKRGWFKLGDISPM